MATTAPALAPQTIANAFVDQYYNILHRSPENVYKFYNDSSTMGRPDDDGVMTSVSTMKAINDKIVATEFSKHYIKIETVDSQLSYNNGVFIVVTGLTTYAGVQRKFAQSFFLAPQDDGGYFVLNDLFRFMSVTEAINFTAHGNGSIPEYSVADEPEAVLTDEQEIPEPLVSVPEVATQKPVEVRTSEISSSKAEDKSNLNQTVKPKQDEPKPTAPLPAQSRQSDAKQAADSDASATLKEGSKKTYASIVAKEPAPAPAPASAITSVKAKAVSKPTAESSEKSVSAAPKPIQSSIVATSNGLNATEKSQIPGFSVYVKDLPSNITAQQLEEEFKKFGAIKPDGVQVRYHKYDNFCFGFVEFEAQESMQAAIEASPSLIGGRQVYVEEKRTPTRVINGVVTRADNGNYNGGRLAAGRGGYRNDAFRGRGDYVNNGGYKRGDYRNQVDYRNQAGFRDQGEYRQPGEYAGRGRPAPVRAVDSYQQQRSNGYQQRGFQNGPPRFSGRFNGVPRQPAPAA